MESAQNHSFHGAAVCQFLLSRSTIEVGAAAAATCCNPSGVNHLQQQKQSGQLWRTINDVKCTQDHQICMTDQIVDGHLNFPLHYEQGSPSLNVS